MAKVVVCSMDKSRAAAHAKLLAMPMIVETGHRFSVFDRLDGALETLPSADLLVCDMSHLRSVLRFWGERGLQPYEQVPTVALGGQDAARDLLSPPLSSVKCVGRMDRLGAFVLQTWRHLANVLTLIEKNEAPTPFHAPDFEKAHRWAERPKGMTCLNHCGEASDSPHGPFTGYQLVLLNKPQVF